MALAKRDGINPKTVANWKKRDTVADHPAARRAPMSAGLSVDDEAIVVVFQRHTLLPLDACLYALQPTIPYLNRCLQCHGIGRLLDLEGEKPAKKRFKPSRSASSTSISRRYRPPGASSTCSSR